ncbi:MAG TPA: DUF2282 domain-containing protein [Acetobacteraceae bacterium]|nr:DUF2282 domain-containing protein [Acetobacteraceae bacterium]
MDRRTLTLAVLGAAATLASAVAAVPASAAPNAVQLANEARASRDHLAACYGINAVARNDCAAGAHSCAGQATMARDPKSFVLIPVGDCAKIDGGSLKPF